MYSPISPEQYNGNQIILNSGRLLFNAKDDAVLIFANKAISLSSTGTINLDSDKDIILNSEEVIHLGITKSNNASEQEEPVLLGDTTIKNITEIFKALSRLSESLSKLYDEKGGGVFYEVNSDAAYLKQLINGEWIPNQDKNKSKKVKLV